MRMGDVRGVRKLCREVESLAVEMEHAARKPLDKLHPDSYWVMGPLPAQSALRRRSLDLTRALARLRKPQV